jgi:quercetin dioxygenase-like cupin family protein
MPHSDKRALSGPLLEFDLASELQTARSQERYAHGDPAGTTLVKEPSLRIVLMAVPAGGRMEQHTASGPISVQVLEGRFHLSTPHGGVDLAPGTLLAIQPGIPHDVEAIEDGAFLLTIGLTTYESVSDHHEPHGQGG